MKNPKHKKEIEDFFEELLTLCKKHDMILTNEHGSFEVERFSKHDFNKLYEADDYT